ncbi:MAG: hypothetical protein HYU68_00280 [Bacteroidetes bacterium]|nr:hypothetical protein [Bacteroidota bacterium]
MKNVVKYVYSWMYQNNKGVSYFEKLLISFTTVLILLLLVLLLAIN